MTCRSAAHTNGCITPSSGCRSRQRRQIWNGLEDALAAASFWTPDPIEEFRPMFDGWDWTVHGRRGGRVACVKRRSPYGAIRDLGQVFLELAGSGEIEDYFRVIPSQD